MEQEVERKIFMLADYKDRFEMEKAADLYVKKLRSIYSYSRVIVTKEFYKNCNILVRATRISTKSRFNNNFKINREELKKEEREERERHKEQSLSRGGRGRGRTR